MQAIERHLLESSNFQWDFLLKCLIKWQKQIKPVSSNTRMRSLCLFLLWSAVDEESGLFLSFKESIVMLSHPVKMATPSIINLTFNLNSGVSNNLLAWPTTQF